VTAELGDNSIEAFVEMLCWEEGTDMIKVTAADGIDDTRERQPTCFFKKKNEIT
jgi:hypothetical protein